MAIIRKKKIIKKNGIIENDFNIEKIKNFSDVLCI